MTANRPVSSRSQYQCIRHADVHTIDTLQSNAINFLHIRTSLGTLEQNSRFVWYFANAGEDQDLREDQWQSFMSSRDTL